LIRLLSLQTLVVVSLIVVAPILSPMLPHDLLNAYKLALRLVFIDISKDLKPAKDGPYPVLLSDM